MWCERAQSWRALYCTVWRNAVRPWVHRVSAPVAGKSIGTMSSGSWWVTGTLGAGVGVDGPVVGFAAARPQPVIRANTTTVDTTTLDTTTLDTTTLDTATAIVQLSTRRRRPPGEPAGGVLPFSARSGPRHRRRRSYRRSSGCPKGRRTAGPGS